MRKIIFILILLLIFAISITTCQKTEINNPNDTTETNKNTIVNPNSTWATLYYGRGAFHVICNVSTEYVFFEKDSIFNKHVYKKVFSCRDKLHENIRYEGLIREHEKKTFFIPVNSKKEYLLYDFSLEEGMTFEFIGFSREEKEKLYVKKCDMIEINGSLKKRLHLVSSRNSYTGDTWIENIGSKNGFFFLSYNVTPQWGEKSMLLCYSENNEIMYKHPDYSECYYDKPEDVINN